MTLTKEEIEAAREKVDEALSNCRKLHCTHLGRDEGMRDAIREATKALDTLCAGAERMNVELAKRPSEADERLVANLRLCLAQRDPSKTAVQEFPRWSAEQCVDELSRRLSTRWELCEAVGSIKRRGAFSRGGMLDFTFESIEEQDKFGEALTTYRAMKGQSDVSLQGAAPCDNRFTQRRKGRRED